MKPAKEEAKNLKNQPSSTLQCSMELFQEKGASAWLTLLPIVEHGFALHKSAFEDAVSLWYGWSLQNPHHTVLVLNEVWDITVSWLLPWSDN